MSLLINRIVLFLKELQNYIINVKENPLRLLYWIFVSPQNSCAEISPPKVMTLGSQAYVWWLGSEGEILMNGFNVLMREIPDISLAFFYTMWRPVRRPCMKQRSGPWPDTKSMGIFISNFAAYRTVRKKLFCLIHLVYDAL